MPTNHFINRDEDSRQPSRLQIGDRVLIIEKNNQGSRDINDLVQGDIIRILSKGNRYDNGAKVQIQIAKEDWRYKDLGSSLVIGRVQYVIKHNDGSPVK